MEHIEKDASLDIEKLANSIESRYRLKYSKKTSVKIELQLNELREFARVTGRICLYINYDIVKKRFEVK
jgi:hypothetical protein